MIKSAHETQVVGRISELKAITALMANGYEVAEPVVAEPYDLLIRREGDKKTYRVQVKTCRVREDRDNAIVVYAKRNNGEPYTLDDCEYIIGVLDNDVYIFECRGVGEYWVTSESINVSWTKLTA